MSKQWVVNHTDVTSFIDFPISGENARVFKNYADKHVKRSDPWMFGTADGLMGLRNRLTRGWEDGARRLEKIVSGDVLPPTSMKRSMRWSDQGDSLDIHKVYAGNLTTAWQRTQRAQRRAPVNVRIIAMLAGSCRQTPDQFFYRGAAVVKLCDMLTAAGYTVEVVAACVAEEIAPRVDYCHTLELKPATAPLDLSTMAAVLCQQGFVRYYMFRTFGGCPYGSISSDMGWYGDYALLNNLALNAFPDNAGLTTVFMSYQTSDLHACQRWITDSIAKIEAKEKEAA